MSQSAKFPLPQQEPLLPATLVMNLNHLQTDLLSPLTQNDSQHCPSPKLLTDLDRAHPTLQAQKHQPLGLLDSNPRQLLPHHRLSVQQAELLRTKVERHQPRSGQKRRHAKEGSAAQPILLPVFLRTFKAKQVEVANGRADILANPGLLWPLQLQAALVQVALVSNELAKR